MKKTLAAVALAGILTLSAGPMAAQAAPTYPSAPSATVSASTVTPGQAFVFSGTGFTPGEIVDVTVTMSSPVAGGAIGSVGGMSMAVPMIIKAAPVSLTATAAADGSFAVNVTLDQTGTYTLTAKGRTSGVTVSQVVKVVTAVGTSADAAKASAVNGAANGTDLAYTGMDSGVLIWSVVGVGALAAGAATVVVSRRRSRTEVAA
ncbi:peptidase [Arthrobacter sp. H14-L1]|uniref:peptidase n=1 Tax=Arthrobacter sp. H14-L1 TaxID=2996697 RepID=UPI002271FA2F|nr:peptidase [Arthrobacter sp. H14-L1]MCY0905471.1 peptidase [Arthrobacter sp. H14-L1]